MRKQFSKKCSGALFVVATVVNFHLNQCSCHVWRWSCWQHYWIATMLNQICFVLSLHFLNRFWHFECHCHCSYHYHLAKLFISLENSLSLKNFDVINFLIFLIWFFVFLFLTVNLNSNCDISCDMIFFLEKKFSSLWIEIFPI